jgi:hypothetical protein
LQHGRVKPNVSFGAIGLLRAGRELDGDLEDVSNRMLRR